LWKVNGLGLFAHSLQLFPDYGSGNPAWAVTMVSPYCSLICTFCAQMRKNPPDDLWLEVQLAVKMEFMEEFLPDR
jgi:hypothetical protein